MAVGEKILKVIFAADAKAVDKAFQSIESHSSTVRQKIGAVGKSMVSAGEKMTTGLTLPIVAGLLEATHLAEKNKVSNQLLERAMVSAGIKGREALRTMTEHSAKFAEQIGVSEIDLKTLEGRVLSMGHTFFQAIGPQAAQADVMNLTTGMENLAAASGKSITMLMRSLGPSILNAPDKAASSLAKFGVITLKQADHIKAMTKAGKAQAATQLELNALVLANGGAAEKAATPLAKLKSTLEHTGIVIGNIVMPYVERFVGWIQQLAQKFQALSPHVQRMIVVAGLLLAALGPVVVIVGTLAIAIGAISLPILAVIAVTAALAFVIYKNWGSISTFIHKHAKAISQTIHVAWATIKFATMATWQAIKISVITPIMIMAKIVISTIEFIARHWKGVWHGMQATFNGVWGTLVGIARPPLNAIITLLNGVISAINAVIKGFNAIPFAPNIPTIPPIPHLAHGTASFAGGLALVGEREPEVVSLPRGAAVSPLSKMGGGDTYNVTVNVPNGYGTDPRALAEIIRRQLLLAAKRNGGKVGLA